ncbi:MAG: hypothetical protein WBQ34_07215 [Candidatus Acidiferrales bacterium]
MNGLSGLVLNSTLDIDAVREGLHRMSDDELMAFGKQTHENAHTLGLSSGPYVRGYTSSIQLDEARAAIAVASMEH